MHEEAMTTKILSSLALTQLFFRAHCIYYVIELSCNSKSQSYHSIHIIPLPRLLDVNRLQCNLAATRRDNSLVITIQVEQLRRIVEPVAN